MTDKMIVKVTKEIVVIAILLIFPILIFYSSKGPISGTDLETPINSEMYSWEITYPYTLNDFGRDSFPNFYILFYWIIAFISGGNIFISQFLLLTLPIIISYIGIRTLMKYFSFRDDVTRVLAVIYALNPAYLAWFTLPLNLSASFIPLCGYYTLQALDYLWQKDKCIKCRGFLKIVLYNAFCYAMLSALFYHYLLWTPLFFTLFWILIKNKKYQYLLSINFLKKLTIFIFTVLLLLTLLNPRLIAIIYYNLLNPYRGFLISMTEGTKNLLYLLRENFSYLYILTYSYGTSSERIFSSLHSRLVLFLPLIIFMYLPILRLDKIRYGQRELYLTSLVISLLVDFIIIILTNIDINVIQANQLVSVLISTIRRPERLLSYFKLLYSIIMLAISIDNIDNVLTTKFGKIKTLHKYKSFMAISLIILYLLYVGIPYDIKNKSYTQHYVPMPAMYFVFTNIYKKLFINHADILLYRYFSVPLYSPWITFLWKNYPNIAYSSSFAANYTKFYYSLLINSLVNGNKSTMLLLSWGGIRYIIIPADANEDLQSWRCAGKPRISSSGTHLYGAPPLYEKLLEEKIFENISYKKFNYGSLKVYEIPSMPTVYVPSKILIIRNASLLYVSDVLLHLYPGLLNNSVILVGFDNLKYFNIINISNNTIAVIIDLKRQVVSTINKYSAGVSEVVRDSTKYLISSKDIIVWSKNYKIKDKNEAINIYIYNLNNNPTSIWVKIVNPFVNLSRSNKSLIKISLTIRDMNIDKNNIKVFVIDSQGREIKPYIKFLSRNDSKTSIFLYISNISINVMYVKFIIYPDYNLVNISNIGLSIARSLNISLISVKLSDQIFNIYNKYFVYVGAKLKLLTNLTSNDILYLISKKNILLFTINNYLLTITNEFNFKYNIQIISPLKIRLFIYNINTRVIVIPIFLGFSSNNWNIQINSPRYVNIKYILINNANLYGKLWILYLNSTSRTTNPSSFIVTIHYNRCGLFLHYLIVSLQVLTIALLIVILINKKYKKL